MRRAHWRKRTQVVVCPSAGRRHTRYVYAGDLSTRSWPRPVSATTLFVDERTHAGPGVIIPRAEVHLMVRFGSPARDGLDIHVMGARQRVHRKLLRGDLQTVTARLELRETRRILGVPASDVFDRIVAIDELWGPDPARRLREQLHGANHPLDAAAIVEEAVRERLTHAPPPRARDHLVEHAIARLETTSVRAVAAELGLSERHLRRVFGEAVGLGPKTFARIGRFRRAMRSAIEQAPTSWAHLAAEAGYYDQAHLITECRAIAGVTPRALLDELRTSHSFGWRRTEGTLAHGPGWARAGLHAMAPVG